MAITYPDTIDTLTNPVSTDTLDSPSHSDQHSDINDAVEALEAKVGADGSAVTTSHDYKLGEVTSTDKVVGKSATQTLTNKTLTNPTVNFTNKAVTQNVCFAASKGTTQSLPSGTFTTVLFDTEEFDVGSDYNTSTGKFVVPVTGYYLLTAGVQLDSLTDGTRGITKLMVGATEIARQVLHASHTQNLTPSVSTIAYLTASDEVTVEAYQITGGAINISTLGGSRFSGILLSI